MVQQNSQKKVHNYLRFTNYELNETLVFSKICNKLDKMLELFKIVAWCGTEYFGALELRTVCDCCLKVTVNVNSVLLCFVLYYRCRWLVYIEWVSLTDIYTYMCTGISYFEGDLTSSITLFSQCLFPHKKNAVLIFNVQLFCRSVFFLLCYSLFVTLSFLALNHIFSLSLSISHTHRFLYSKQL